MIEFVGKAASRMVQVRSSAANVTSGTVRADQQGWYDIRIVHMSQPGPNTQQSTYWQRKGYILRR